MPDMTITIGGREFVVACQAGEEDYLIAAAKMLDEEATILNESGVRLTLDRMLLMAGLMIADKALNMEEERHILEEKLGQQAARIDELQDHPPPEVQRVEVLPERTVERLTEMAEKAEHIAARLESRDNGFLDLD